MQSQVDQISPVVVEVKIEVPWTKVNENLEGAYRNLQRTARVRGFRPGQGAAPRGQEPARQVGRARGDARA